MSGKLYGHVACQGGSAWFRLLPVVLCTYLTACGGGGGGGGGDGAAPPAPAQQFPSVSAPQLAAIDGEPLVTMDRRSSRTMLDALLFFIDFGDGMYAEFSQAVFASAAHTNQVEVEQLQCGGGSGRQLFQFTPAGTGRLVVEYQNCSDGYTINRGTQDLTVTKADLAGHPLDYTMVLAGREIEDVQSGDRIRLQGTITVTGVYGGVTVLQNLEAIDLNSGQRIQVADFSSFIPIHYWPDYARATRSGQIYDSAGGRAVIGMDSNQTTLLALSGAGAARLAVDFTYSSALNLFLHTDSDNQPEAYAFAVPPNRILSTGSGNQLPELSVMQPNAVDRSKHVLIHLTRVFDPEYDFMTFRGEVISGPSGADARFDFSDPTQPLFVSDLPGDYVLRISVADGTGTVYRDVSLHVRALAPVVAASPLQVINQPQPLSISLQPASAIDGPYQYRLLDGPVGLTVDGSGLMTWAPTASSPFSATLHRALVEVSNADHTLEQAVVLQVNDAGKPDPVVGIDGRFAGKVLQSGNFDGDSRQEVLLARYDMLYTIEWNGTEYVKDWVLPFRIGLDRRIVATAANLDSDPELEIVVVVDDGSALLILDNGREVRRTRLASGFITAVEVADIDLDGNQEIVLAQMSNDQRVMVVDAQTLNMRWTSDALSADAFAGIANRGLALGNVDSDPALEIVTTGGYVIDGISRQVQWHHAAGFGSTVVIGNIQGRPDGIAQIVSFDARSYDVRLFDVLQQEQAAIMNMRFWCGMNIADTDASGGDELLVHACDGTMKAYTMIGAPSIIWQFPTPLTLEGGKPLFGDFDNDGLPEVMWASTLGDEALRVASLQSLAIEWDSLSQPGFNRFDIGVDFQADSATHEAWFLGLSVDPPAPGTASRPWIARIDYDDGSLLAGGGLVGGFAGGYTVHELVLGDYDGDERSEIIVRSADGSGGHLRLVDPITGAVERNYSHPVSYVNGTVVGRLNADAYPDIAAVFGNEIVLYDAQNDTVIDTIPGFSLFPIQDLHIADLDGDGKGELLVLGERALIVYGEAAGSYQLLRQYSTGGFLHSLLVDDIDGDLAMEVVVSVAGPSGRPRVVVLDGQLQPIRSVEVDGVVRNLQRDRFGGPDDLLASVRSKRLLPPDTSSSDGIETLTSFNVSTGVINWSSLPLHGSIGDRSMRYGSPAAGGAPRLLIGTDSAMYVVQ